ncbi:hypothetical protein [Sphingomonas sp. AX6]|nr:hypothetical protein [Sphingomonas sp. AX6]
MFATTSSNTGFTLVERARLKIGSALLALVILGMTSIAITNGQLSGLQ